MKNWMVLNMAAKKNMSKTAQLARELKTALEADLDLGRKMLAALDAQTEALVANDPHGVASLERKARALARQQEVNDRLRTAAIIALASALGTETADDMPLPPLSDLALGLPLAEAKGVLALRTGILANHEKIRHVNDRNRTLLENALDCVRTLLGAIKECAFKPARYGTNPNTLTPATLYINQTV